MNKGWSIVTRGHDPITIEPTVNSCREYDCCLGELCGFSLKEAKNYVINYHREQAGFFDAMSDEQFQAWFGYGPWEEDIG